MSRLLNNNITTISLFFATCAHAMDLEMVIVKPRKFSQVATGLQIKNWPIELRAKVAENIIDLFVHEYENAKECIDHKKCEKWNLNKLLLGIEYAQEFYQLQKICEREICGKKFLAQELFGLQCKYRDIFIRLVHPSAIQQLAKYNIEVDDCRELFRPENYDIREGMQLTILNGSKVGYWIFALCCFGFVGSLLGILLSICMDPISQLSRETKTLMLSTCGISFLVLMIMGLLDNQCSFILPQPVKV